MEKEKMKKKRLYEILFVVILLIIVGFLIFVFLEIIYYPNRASYFFQNYEKMPILVVSVDSCDFDIEDGECSTVITGNVVNIGDKEAKDVIVRCRPAVYPLVETNIQASRKIGDLNFTQETSFEIKRQVECGNQLKFDCIAECENC